MSNHSVQRPNAEWMGLQSHVKQQQGCTRDIRMSTKTTKGKARKNTKLESPSKESESE